MTHTEDIANTAPGRIPTRGRFWPWIAVTAGLVVAFALSCQIMAATYRTDAHADASVTRAMLGSSRMAISGYFYGVADQYFHKGVRELGEEAPRGLFQRLRYEMAPVDHLHVVGYEASEMMPWLWLAIRADPQNVAIYLVSAFWLAKECREYGLALEVLREGQAQNPYSHAIQLQKGHVYLMMRDHGKALATMEAALHFWDASAPRESEDAWLARIEILTLLGVLCEEAGRNEQAVAALQEVVARAPDRTAVRSRLDHLVQGGAAERSATEEIRELLNAHVEGAATCHRDASPGTEGEHEHGSHCNHLPDTHPPPE